MKYLRILKSPMVIILIICLLFTALFVFPKTEAKTKRPKLVIMIAVDGLGADIFNRYDSLFTGGFRRLKDEGMNEEYLNVLNEKLLNELQQGGEVFLSNAIVADKYCLRACIVNFRTSKKDIYEVIDIIVREGRKVHDKLQIK